MPHVVIRIGSHVPIAHFDHDHIGRGIVDVESKLFIPVRVQIVLHDFCLGRLATKLHKAVWIRLAKGTKILLGQIFAFNYAHFDATVDSCFLEHVVGCVFLWVMYRTVIAERVGL